MVRNPSEQWFQTEVIYDLHNYPVLKQVLFFFIGHTKMSSTKFVCAVIGIFTFMLQNVTSFVDNQTATTVSKFYQILFSCVFSNFCVATLANFYYIL